jgi:chromosome segregation ATPase
MFTKLGFHKAAEGEKIPDALNELEREIAAKKEHIATRRREIQQAAETLKIEDAEREQLERQRQFVITQMTHEDKRAALRPEFDKAHRRFILIWREIAALKAQIVEAEVDNAALNAALEMLTQANPEPLQSRMTFSALLDQMQAAGMPSDEVSRYQSEIAALQQAAPRPKGWDMTDMMRRRDIYVAKYSALIQQIMKG